MNCLYFAHVFVAYLYEDIHLLQIPEGDLVAVLLSNHQYGAGYNSSGFRYTPSFHIAVSSNAERQETELILIVHTLKESESQRNEDTDDVRFVESSHRVFVSISMGNAESHVPVWVSYDGTGEWTLCAQFTNRCDTLNGYPFPLLPHGSKVISELYIGPVIWRDDNVLQVNSGVEIKDISLVEEQLGQRALSGKTY